MKLICAILSIYIFSLFTMPCGDNDNCAASEIHAGTNEEQDHREEKSCSPFCACACCSSRGIEIEPSNEVAAVIIPQFENKITPYQSQFFSQFTASIWQPPKLS